MQFAVVTVSFCVGVQGGMAEYRGKDIADLKIWIERLGSG